jgi:valyl-tRNA synthetase
LPLAGLVDFAAERARLDREIAKERAEVAKVDVKLNNQDFVSRAPEEIIEENRERREAALARVAELEGARARLENL